MKHIKLFENFNYKKISIKDIKDYILIKKDNLLLLLSPTEEPIGYISYGYTDSDVYSIYGVYAKKGYGTLLYEIVMNNIYPKGITLSDESVTSQDALNVYKRFFERDDIKKEKIIRTKISDKEKDLINGSDINDDWVKEILYLHNHKYIFEFNNLSKNILKHILNSGDEYLKNNPDLFIDEILWDLESM